jgi:hypothetical protein
LFKARQFFLARPQHVHVRARDLVGLFLVGGAGRWPHLRLALPAGVVGLAQRVLGFYCIRQREEGFGGSEGGANFR